MSVFEPDSVIATLCSTLSIFERPKFKGEWNTSVQQRASKWLRKRESMKSDDTLDTQSFAYKQLLWISHCVEYVDYIHKATHVHGNSKKAAKTSSSNLPSTIPLYGPLFLPPPLLYTAKRNSSANITPDTLYLRWFYAAHPVFHPLIKTCPACSATDIKWEGWTSTGPRDVHGVRDEGYTLGYQLRCSDCSNCSAMTNPKFWAKMQLWELPRGMPVFFHRTAVSRDLFDLIAQLRLKGTGGGLEDHIKQLHLLEYRSRSLEYITFFGARLQAELKRETKETIHLVPFSDPYDKTGYNCKHITSDMIAEVYTEWSRSREKESTQHTRTLSGIVISLDATFKIGSRTKVVDKNNKRVQLMKGGLVQVLNEKGETISWRLCQTRSGAEYSEILTDLRDRCKTMGISFPVQAIVDDCCHSESAIKAPLPDISIGLDVWHCVYRYKASLLGATKNPHCSEVTHDLTHAILQSTSREQSGAPAIYWSKEEQATRLEVAYEKWETRGGVWSAASAKVHQNQLRHVRKGCLTRARPDLPSDGSRIESSHKGWNSIMRTNPCGLELFVQLAFDHILRRNINIASKSKALDPKSFTAYLFGSHHIGLADHIAQVWNSLCDEMQTYSNNQLKFGNAFERSDLPRLPRLPTVATNERFGIVSSVNTDTFGGLFEIKQEDDDGEEVEPKVSATPSEDDVLIDQGIDHTLRYIPAGFQMVGTRVVPVHSSATQAVSCSNTTTDPAISGQETAASPQLLPFQDQKPAFTALEVRTHTESNSCSDGTRSQENDDLCGSELRDIVDLTSNENTSGPSPQIMSSINAAASMLTSPTPVPGKRKPESDDPDGTFGVTLKRSKIVVAGTASSLTNHPPSISLHSFFNRHNKPISTNGATISSLSEAKFTPSASNQHTLVNTTGIIEVSSALSKQRSKRTIADLSMPFPFPDEMEEGRRLTRSEKFFFLATSTHPLSLSIEGLDELLVFMDMRCERKWASFMMSPKAWVDATVAYNERLQARKAPVTFVRKNPRALIEHCAWIEKQVLIRMQTRDFTSKTSGTETFWRAACEAVHLGKDWEAAKANIEEVTKPRKPMTCTRCNSIMYPYKEGHPSNHSKGYCSDGAPVNFQTVDARGKKKNVTSTSVPPWPQPLGLFETSVKEGTKFHVIALLEKLHDLYQQIVIDKAPAENLSMEDQAFGQMVNARHKTLADGNVYFRLYPWVTNLDLTAVSSALTDINGEQCIRLNCVSPSPSDPPISHFPHVAPAAPATSTESADF